MKLSLLPTALISLTTCVSSLHAQTTLSGTHAPAAATTGTSSTAFLATQPGLPPDVVTALKLPDGRDKNTALGTAVKAWAAQDATAGLKWLYSLPPTQFGPARGMVGFFGGSPNAKNSADWIVQQGPTRLMEFLHPMMIGWAMANPADAEAWCAQLQSKDEHIRHYAFYSVADGLARKKADLATAWIAQLQPGTDRHSAIAGLVTIWARGGLVDATPWINKQAPDDLKQAAQVVVGVWNTAKNGKGVSDKWHTPQEWLDQTSLSPADKEYVLKNPQS